MSEPSSKVVSVSLGSPSRDWTADLSPSGVPLTIERRGVGRNYRTYTETLAALDLDPAVAAIGLGGINRYLFSGTEKYSLRKADEMVSVVSRKPVCDGSVLKQYWEPYIVQTAVESGQLDLRGKRVLMVCAADRWGMAAELAAQGAKVVVGDLMFALGIPVPLHSLATTQKLTRVLLPTICKRVPFEWLYPTGESRDVPKYLKWYAWADVIAGDYKFISKHMPAGAGALAGKWIVTNTTTPKDVAALRERGVACLLTTTPSLNGRSFGTNAVEAAASALAGRPPSALGLKELLAVFSPLGWHQPCVQSLQK